jgi:hypothetical protein
LDFSQLYRDLERRDSQVQTSRHADAGEGLVHQPKREEQQEVRVISRFTQI